MAKYSNKNDGSEIEAILTLCTKLKVEMVILGYPRNLSGNPTQQTTQVEAFGDKLKSAIELPVEYQDETLSSIYVEEQLSEDKKGKKPRIDDQAAALFLQDYLESKFRKVKS